MEEPTITKSRRGVAGPEFNKELKGIVHCEFVPPNTMLNSDFYCEVLKRLKENV
jgi:hypothetical protein